MTAPAWPEPAAYPGVVLCKGGWFAVEEPRSFGSGPWRTESAAKLALVGEFDGAALADEVRA